MYYMHKERKRKGSSASAGWHEFYSVETSEKHLKENGFSFEENGIFAWVPTLTSVSRQAIFQGAFHLHLAKQ